MIDGLVASSLWIVGMYSAALLSVEEVAKHGWQGHTALWWRSICVNYLWLKRTLHGSNSILQPAGAAQQHQRKLSFESIHTHTQQGSYCGSAVQRTKASTVAPSLNLLSWAPTAQQAPGFWGKLGTCGTSSVTPGFTEWRVTSHLYTWNTTGGECVG